MIGVALDRAEARCGEKVRATATWTPTDGKTAKGLAVQIVLETRIRNTWPARKEVLAEARVELAPGAPGTASVEVEIPREGPLPYDGKNLHFRWKAVASADVDWAIDPTAEAEISVRPGR